MLPLHPDDLLLPRGRLNSAALWPRTRTTVVLWKSEITTKLTAFIEDGETHAAALSAADRPAAVRQWAYYRAYSEVYERLVAMPASVDVANQGSSSYFVTQLQLMGELRDQALAAFTDLLEAAPADSTPVTRESYSAPVRYQW